MKPTDFDIFKKEFTKWQNKFGLTGWAVYFKHGPIEGAFASINIDLSNMVATVRLNSELPEKDKVFKDVKKTAKHEALHLLIARLEHNGKARYITGDEIYESSEELVRKLEGLVE